MQPYPRAPDLVWPGHLHGTGCLSARAVGTGFPTVGLRLWLGPGCGWSWVLFTPARWGWGLGWVCLGSVCGVVPLLPAVCGVRGWALVWACFRDLCGFLRVSLAPRRFRFRCAVWAPGSRLCPALLGWVVGLCFLRFFVFFFFFWLLAVLVPGLVVSPPSPFFRGLLAFFFFFFVSVSLFSGGPLSLPWCCRSWLGGPPVPVWGSCLWCPLGGGFGPLLYCWWAVWWLWAVFAARPPPPPFFFFFFFFSGGGGLPGCSSRCLPSAGGCSVAGVWCGWSLATPGRGSCVLLPATPGWVSLPVVVGGPRHSWLGFAGGGGVWCVAVVCWWGCGWCVVWLVPRHSWRRFLCATPRHSWLGFASGGVGRAPPLLAGVRWRRCCVVCGVWRWCVGGVVAGVWCGWSLATPGGGSCVLLPATPGWVSLPVVVGGPRHSWLGSACGGGVWCVVCGVWRWCVGGVVAGVWCGWSLATPGGGSCVLLPATPSWVSLPVVVGGPRHSWLGSVGGVAVWCVVCGGGVLVGLWLVCGVVGPSPLLAEVPVCYSPPLLAGFRCRWRWAVPATPGWGPLAAVVCGVWCVVCGGGVLVGLWLVCGVVGPSPLLAEVPVCYSPPLLAGFRFRWWWAVPATPGWGPLAALLCGVWCVALVCWWGCGWRVVWLVPRHSWRRFLCATPRHSWLGFAAGGGGRSPPLLAGVRLRRWCVVCGVWCVAVVCWWGCGWCVVWLVPRHSWRRFLCATPRHSWLGFAAAGGGRSPPLLAGVRWRRWCVVCCWGPSPLLAEVPVCYSPPLLAGFRCRWWWAVPATPGWGPLAAVVCVFCLAGSGGPASRARCGAPHLFLWPLCLSALLGPLRAGVAPLSFAAVAVPRWLGFVVCGLAVAWHLFVCRGSLRVVRALRVCGTRRPLLLGTCPCALVVAGGVPLWRASWPRVVRRASSGPVALGAPVGFPDAVVPFPGPGACAPGFTGRLRGARGGRPRTGLIVPAAGPRRGRGAGLSASYPFGAPRWGCPWRVPPASVLGCVRCGGWRVRTRSLTRPVSRTVRLSTGDSAGAPGLFRVDADTSPCGSEDATPGSRACLRVLALLGRVGRAGLPGAFWCASPFPLAALSFCFAWPPPGWGCPSLFRCCCLSLLVVFLGLLLLGSRLVCVLRLAVGCSLVVAPPPRPPLCLGLSSLLLVALVFFFFFFFLLSPCAPVVSGFLWFPAPGALGLGACVVCFVGLPLLGSPCACPSFVLSPWLLAAPAWLLPPPPPPFVSRGFRSCRSVLCAVLCCASPGAVRCCAALLPVVSPGVVLACAVLRSFGAAACCAVPSGAARRSGPCALRRCVLRCSPALCALCVLSWRGGACCAFPVLSVLCGAVLRCAGALALCCWCCACCCWRSVLWCAAVCCAVSCGVPWCGAGSGGPWLSAGGVFRCRCPCLAAWSASLCLVWFAVVPCFPVSCSVVLCCRVVLCCCALLSCCGAVGACFALLWAVVLCCVVLLVGGGGVCVLWCSFPRAVCSLSSPLCALRCLVVLAVVPCFPVSCAVPLCCRVVLCCRALLSFCSAVCVCFALLRPVVRRLCRLRCCWCLVLWRVPVRCGVSLGVLRCGGAALVCRGVLLCCALSCGVLRSVPCPAVPCCPAVLCWLAVLCGCLRCWCLFCPLFFC